LIVANEYSGKGVGERDGKMGRGERPSMNLAWGLEGLIRPWRPGSATSLPVPSLDKWGAYVV